MIPTRYGQRLPCGVFVGIVSSATNIRALYIPTEKFLEYNIHEEPELTNQLVSRQFSTSVINGKKNTSDIDIPLFSCVTETELNGYCDWYVPSAHEATIIYEFTKLLPIKFRYFCNRHISEYGVHFIHTSTVRPARDFNQSKVNQICVESNGVQTYQYSLDATLIPARSDIIVRKV